MTLVELQKHLGERVTITLDNTLTPEQRKIENEQTAFIVGIAKQMINNGNLILNYERNLAQCNNLEHSVLKEMIGE